MNELHRWWQNNPAERYWLEVTDRPDVGANLKAPQRKESGGEFWSYALVREVRAGDVVFHYDKLSQTVMGVSSATGDVWEDRIVWGARGMSARALGVIPHERAGWYAGLKGFELLPSGLTLSTLRNRFGEILKEYEQLLQRVGAPLYFAFETGTRRPTRPLQGYLFKLPAFFVRLSPELDVRGLRPPERRDFPLLVREIGQPYRQADEETSVGAFDPLEVDPAVVERGTRGHAVTQNALASSLTGRGFQPRSPTSSEPDYDLAWETDNVLYVAEVKSVTNRNELRQLRFGLGQLLDYRHKLSLMHEKRVIGVLVTERKPPESWVRLCRELSILIVWPGHFDLLYQ